MPNSPVPATDPAALPTELPSELLWPATYAPSEAVLFASNQIVIPAPPEHIWRWLLRAELWPTWYANARDVHFLSHTGPDLRNRSRLRWRTSGANLVSKVLEFQPNRRLAWDSHGIGLQAYHIWLLTPIPGDTPQTHVLTQETQHGWRTSLHKVLRPRHLETTHQLWLEALSRQVQSGPPT